MRKLVIATDDAGQRLDRFLRKVRPDQSLGRIYKALRILLPDDKAADGWVRLPNAAPLFGGRSALERMLGGQVGDLYVVRQYLDAQRGGKA